MLSSWLRAPNGVVLEDLGNVPQRHLTINAAGSQCVAVGRKGDGLEAKCTFEHGGQDFAAGEIPKVQRAIASRRSQKLAVRRQTERANQPLVPFELADQLARVNAPDAEDTVLAAGD